MNKAFAVESVKTVGEAGSGQFEAIVSVFNNVDHGKDVVRPGAFKHAIENDQPPPIVWSHHWSIPPVGETLEWSEKDRGLFVKGALFVGADDKHQYADMVYAAMKSRDGRPPALREFSFSYDIPDGGMVQFEEKDDDGEPTGRILNELKELYPIPEVGPCLRGMNPATEMVTAPKSYTDGLVRMERLAKKSGLSLDALIGAIEKAYEDDEVTVDDAVRSGIYPPEVTDLLLFTP